MWYARMWRCTKVPGTGATEVTGESLHSLRFQPWCVRNRAAKHKTAVQVRGGVEGKGASWWIRELSHGIALLSYSNWEAYMEVYSALGNASELMDHFRFQTGLAGRVGPVYGTNTFWLAPSCST